MGSSAQKQREYFRLGTLLLSPSIGRARSGLFLALLSVAVLGYAAWSTIKKGQGASNIECPDMPVAVLAASPRIQDVPVYLDAIGTVRALNTVTVRPQIDGKLATVSFVEGQEIGEGDVLGEIEPAIYQIQYDQAVAKKAQSEALLANQRNDLARYEQLAASNTGSRQQVDTQRALVAQTEALVKADQAVIDNAAVTLGYTRIVAPISGQAGLRQIDKGNIVNAAEKAALVVLTQLQPISVIFSLPQQEIMRVNEAASNAELLVEVFGNDGMTPVDSGKLTGIDNQVDPATGTLRLKAEFPNTVQQLWPGQLVSLRLKVDTLPGANVLPVSAVQRGPAGTFIYTVGEGEVVAAKPVKVTLQDEHIAVVTEGVSASDRVVTTGFAKLADGAVVSVGRDGQVRGSDARKCDGKASAMAGSAGK